MLVKRGLTVIAGLAKGIDTFAHQTALNDGGRTVAFIGTGIDRQYPTENRGLQQEIEERGLVLSQFWPGSQPTKQSFPMRNALMSGYGVATIMLMPVSIPARGFRHDRRNGTAVPSLSTTWFWTRPSGRVTWRADPAYMLSTT